MKTPLDNDLKKVYEAFNQKHDQLRESLMASLPGTSKGYKQRSKLAHIGAFIGDTIMKSRTTKFATAAMIIIAVLIGIKYFGGPIDGASAAWADVIENTKKMLWLHTVANGTQKGKEVVTEQWMSFESKVFAYKLSDGHIRYYDYSKQKLWEYEPQSRTISISYPKYKGDNIITKLKSIGSFLGIAIEELTKIGGNVIERSGTYNGNTVRIYEVTFSEHPAFKKFNIKFFVDPNSQLVIAEKIKATDENGNILMEAEGKIDYPETGPTCIYDLGVPSSAKIIGSEKAETEFQQVFNKAIAIIDSRKSWPEPYDLVVTYWKARATKNYDEMAILWPGSATWNRQVLEKEEPVEYVFGEVQTTEFEGHIIVPYATKSYYEKHGKYSLKMCLENRKSNKGRYYISSGN
jgi:hypothetical protein